MICARVLLSAAVAVVLFWNAPATAHSRGASYSFWTLTGNQAQVRARIPELELSRAGLLPEDPDYLSISAQLLMTGLQLTDNNGRCNATRDLPPRLRDGQLVVSWRVLCAGPPQRLTSHLAQVLGSSHSHFLTLHQGAGAPVTKVLTTGENAWINVSPRSTAAPSDGLLAFIALGLRHILSGWDHLLFLVALIAVATSLREVAWLATGFTLGHSLTLALAVLGLARPASAAVEALIALSILGLALENGWRLDKRSAPLAWLVLPGLLVTGWLTGVLPLLVIAGLILFTLAYVGLLRTNTADFRMRLALTAGFGLFHGFGFAGVLTGMALPPAKTVQALFGFNIGVEAGQLLLLALVWPLLRWMRGRDWPAAESVTVAAASVAVWVYLLRVLP